MPKSLLFLPVLALAAWLFANPIMPLPKARAQPKGEMAQAQAMSDALSKALRVMR